MFKYRLVMKTKWQLRTGYAAVIGQNHIDRFLCSNKIPQQLAAFSCRTISSICQPRVLYVCHIPVG